MTRFWDKVNKRGGIHPKLRTHCWIWTAGKTGAGYGAFKINGRTLGAHRLSFIWSGGKIPKGFVLDHLCRREACVRPSHLEPVTNQINTHRGLNIVAINAAKIVCSRGHKFTGTQKGGKHRRCRACDNITQQRRRRQLKVVVCA